MTDQEISLYGLEAVTVSSSGSPDIEDDEELQGSFEQVSLVLGDSIEKGSGGLLITSRYRHDASKISTFFKSSINALKLAGRVSDTFNWKRYLPFHRRIVWISNEDRTTGLAARFSDITLHAVSQVSFCTILSM